MLEWFDKRSTFKRLEMIIATLIVAALVVVIFIYINPQRRFAEIRNAHRARNAETYAIGIQRCVLEREGDFDLCTGGAQPYVVYEIVTDLSRGCQSRCGDINENRCVELDEILKPHVTHIPVDPGSYRFGHTGYSLTVNERGLVVVGACLAELGRKVRALR